MSYNEETGHFYWLITGVGNCSYGKQAGHIDKKGYVRIRIKGKAYSAHRLAWLYVFGEWPKYEIDHINGIACDNRICNLRDVRHAENMQNLKNYSTNKSGYIGVRWRKSSKKWHADIKVNGRTIYVGLFDSAEDAITARKKAKAMYHTLSRQ